MFTEMGFREKVMRKLGPTRLIAISFLLIVAIGTILLMLPFSNNNGVSLPFLDTLFIATSATCVTGLVPVPLVGQYTVFGQIVILFMIQIGGLGVMSLIAFALTILKRRLHHSEKKMLQDALNKDDLQDIPRFLIGIVKYTFVFEGIGFLILLIRFIPQFGCSQGLFNAIFLSISAFCNAGMDNFSFVSLGAYTTDALVNCTVAFLIITGGLGFAVWFDLRKRIPEAISKKQPLRKFFHNLSTHTKVVLVMTFSLIVSGMIFFYIVEYNNPSTLGPLNFFDRLLTSFFQSVTLRTAGFSTVDFATLKDGSLFYMLIYMLIGGSPGGTAGGIKTTAVVMMILMIRSLFENNHQITVFQRTIPESTFQRSFIIVLVYAIALFTSVFVLTITENIPFLPLLFEAFSAIATVGLSAGVTPLLSGIGKFIIILLMYMGRVGPITIVLSMIKVKGAHKPTEVMYPEADILIG